MTMRKIMFLATLLLCGVTANAQDKPEKPSDSLTGAVTSFTAATAPMRQQATWSDKITKDGHYVGVFDDPNNDYRCDVVSYLDIQARNALYSDITSLTIVCTKKREPPREK